MATPPKSALRFLSAIPVRGMLLQPREIFIDFGGINDEQKFCVAGSVNDQVINHTAVIIQQKSVLPLTDVQFGNVIGQHSVEPVARAVSRDDELSHVGNIEHSRPRFARSCVHPRCRCIAPA
jgi:hypothetical protein